MCICYSVGAKIVEIDAVFQTKSDFQFSPSYKNYPGSKLPIVIQEDLEEDMEPVRNTILANFGLLLGWNSGIKLHNARVESLVEKPFFKKLLDNTRCVIPTTGFFEWKKLPNDKKLPFRFEHKQKIFGLAGLWHPQSEKAPEASFTIITVPANKDVSSVHERMPAVMDPKDTQKWLDGDMKILKPPVGYLEMVELENKTLKETKQTKLL